MLPFFGLVKVLEEKGESVAPGTVLGTTHTYVIKTGTQDKTGAKRVSSSLLLNCNDVLHAQVCCLAFMTSC